MVIACGARTDAEQYAAGHVVMSYNPAAHHDDVTPASPAPAAHHDDVTPASPAPKVEAMFQKGLDDRTSWETWFNGLQGDEKVGAFYWASQRSVAHPGSCQQMNDEFYHGCTSAKVKLAAREGLNKELGIDIPIEIAAASDSVGVGVSLFGVRSAGFATVVTQSDRLRRLAAQ
jgi:hypothetical protein